MATCGQCGSESLYCTCLQSAQPFCDQCSQDTSCAQIMDAQCVIYHPDNDKPSKLNNLGMPNGSSSEAIFEAIDKFLGNNANVPLTIIDTLSIDLTTSGVAAHTLKADIKVSPDANNQLEIRSNGVFAKPYNENYLLKVSASDTPDYLINQMNGGSDGVISITLSEDAGQVKVTPSINITCLLDEIKNDPALLAKLCQVVDMCKCFITVTNKSQTFAPPCSSGFTLSGGVCTRTETTAPTISSSVIDACTSSFGQYSAYGAIVYKDGFVASGGGIGTDVTTDIAAGHVVPITTLGVWKSDNVTGNNDGPMNRAGVWACGGIGTVGSSLGFAVPVNIVTTKTYYIAIAADDEFTLKVDGSVVVATVNGSTTYWNNDGGAKFRYWHIYPIVLNAGQRTIELIGRDTGGVNSSLAAEIYDNTLAQLQAAALDPAFIASPGTFPYNQSVYSNLNLVFSTRCGRNGTTSFAIGNATCPDSSWTLDTTGGGAITAPCQGIGTTPASWTCKRVTNLAFTGYTATVVFDKMANAVSYTVQVKETGAPDNTYVAGATVAQPVGGTTVSAIISGLSSNTKTFRVRVNYTSCSSDWVV